MEKIVIGFSRPKNWLSPFSWLIRLVEWTSYSHVYVRYYNSYAKRWLVFQASGTKVNFIGKKLFDSEEIVYKEFEIPISKEIKLKTIRFAIDNCGKPYGVGQIIGFGWVLLMRLFGKKVKNPFGSRHSFFCSELVEKILNEKMQEGDTMNPSSSSPRDIYNFMIDKKFKILNEGINT